MSDRTDRFSKRKKQPRLAALLAPVPAPVLPSVEEEASALLVSLDSTQAAARMERRLGEAKTTAIAAIAVPFGLGSAAAALDRKGGDVNTVHNVRQGTYASKAEEKRYEDRGEYDSTEYHSHKNYRAANKEASERKAAGTLVDVHTGQVLGTDEKHNLDHFISAKSHHDDPGRVLAETSGPDLANMKENLGPTHESINKSKQAKMPGDYVDTLVANAEKRRADIEKLMAKQDRTPKEDKKLRKLQAQERVDGDLVRENGAKAQKAADKKVNKDYYGSKKFATGVTISAAKGAATSGLQRAVGELVTEFFAASFDEVAHWHKTRPAEGQWMQDLRERLERIALRVASRRNAALAALGQGMLAGLLSSLVTTAINIFATTQKNMVRVIREGLSSLSRTVALLFDPNKSFKEALHAGIHITAATGVIIGGIALEEYLHAQLLVLPPPLASLAGVITAAVVGALTALTVVVLAALLDWIDPLGVVADQNERELLHKLEARADACMLESERMLLLAAPSTV